MTWTSADWIECVHCLGTNTFALAGRADMVTPEANESLAADARSAQQALNNLAMRDRHGPIVGRVDHALRVDAHSRKQGGGQVLQGHRVLCRRSGFGVGGAVHHSRSSPSACQDAAEAVGIVVTAILTSPRIAKAGLAQTRCPAKLAAKIDDGVLQQAARQQVLQ